MKPGSRDRKSEPDGGVKGPIGPFAKPYPHLAKPTWHDAKPSQGITTTSLGGGVSVFWPDGTSSLGGGEVRFYNADDNNEETEC